MELLALILVHIGPNLPNMEIFMDCGQNITNVRTFVRACICACMILQSSVTWMLHALAPAHF